MFGAEGVYLDGGHRLKESTSFYQKGDFRDKPAWPFIENDIKQT